MARPVTTSLEWRACPRFPDYEISSSGDLRRTGGADIRQPGRRLNGVIDADGYIRYAVRDPHNRRHVVGAHQMVAEAFICLAPSPQHQVAHNNGSRLLNTPENLRWATAGDNQLARIVHHTHAQGARNGRSKITEDDVRYIRRRYRELKICRESVGELDRKFGLSRSQIIDIAKGKAWSHVQ